MRGRGSAIGMGFLMALSLLGGLVQDCPAQPVWNPKQIQVPRIEAQGVSYRQLAEQLRLISGLTVELESWLPDQNVNLRLRDLSLQSVLDVALPSQGATWEITADSILRLSPLSRPWHGYEPTGETLAGQLPDRKNFQVNGLTIQSAVNLLRDTYQVNVICDYRIQPRPVRLSIPQATFDEAFHSLAVWGGWIPLIGEEIALILPSPDEQLMNFPSPQWQNWTYTQVRTSDVLQDLALDFGISIHPSLAVADYPFDGKVQGRTFQDVIESFSRRYRFVYGVFNNTLYLCRNTELPTLVSNLPLPRLEIRAQYLEIPTLIWDREKVDQTLFESPHLSPEELEQRVQTLRQNPQVRFCFDTRLTLVSGTSGEARVNALIPPEEGDYFISGRFRLLDLNHVNLIYRLRKEGLLQEPQVAMPAVENELIRLDRPILVSTPPQQIQDPERFEKLLYLTFQLKELSTAIDNPDYRATTWYIPLGPTRRLDQKEDRYYQQFPGEWSHLFIPTAFSGSPEN